MPAGRPLKYKTAKELETASSEDYFESCFSEVIVGDGKGSPILDPDSHLPAKRAPRRPIEEWIFFDHPSGRNRIAAAMRWKAENLKLFTAK